ncbi:MAG: hypothetical protein AAGD00_00960 [Planctomycetota bacterium]
MHRATRFELAWSITLALSAPAFGATHVSTPAELVDAVTNGDAGDTVLVAPGTYSIGASLLPKQGMAIIGTGPGESIIRNDAAIWNVGNAGLPDNAVDSNSVDRSAYLINLDNNTTGVTIANLTLIGPELHGAIFGNNSDGLVVRDCTIDSFLWSGVRLFRVNDGAIHGNTFIDAGGRAQVTSGPTGGSIFSTFHTTTDIFNNTFALSPSAPSNVFGVKGRKFNDTRIYHNTIDVSFSIELPFENDDGVEIFANWLDGVVSIPKFAGGPTLALGESFDIHRNYFQRTYSIEGPRNGLEVHRNLFDFQLDDDGGNLITTFGNNGSPVTPGPTAFHNNNVRNPGRGVFWSAPIYDAAEFFNNHIITNTTVTPRTEGLFGFKLNANNDGDVPALATLSIRDNIIEMNGLSRPLIRNSSDPAVSAVEVENNTLTNVSDTGNYANADTGAPRGPVEPLRFRVGAERAFFVDGFSIVHVSACAIDLSGDGAADVEDLYRFNASPADVSGDGSLTPTDRQCLGASIRLGEIADALGAR